MSDGAGRPAQNTVSLIIRAWREKKDGDIVWHFRVHDVNGNRHHGIADVPSLKQFLEDYFDTGNDTPDTE